MSRSVSNIDSDNTWSSWNNDESECQTLSNPQSDNEKGSRTPESGYRSGDDADQQESKIVALPNRQPNAGKSSIAPKPANPQTKPQASPAKRMTENKISNPSFNKGHGFSSNLAADSIKEKIKMFENNTSFSFNRESSFSSVKEPAKQEPRTSVKANSQMAEDKISNPSFNKGHDFSFNLAANSIKKKIKMFENNTSSNPSSKVLSGSIKKALNRNNFLLKTPPLK